MNVQRVLFFCLLSAAPLSRHSGLVGAEDLVLSGTAGQNLTFQCRLPFYGNRKLFCRGECVGGDVLIETTAREAHNGRYSIEYQGSSLFSSTLNVTIRHLTRSDSGRYTCGQSGILNFYQTVNLNVEDGHFLPLVVSMPMIVLLLALVLLLVYRVKKRRRLSGLKTRENVDNGNTKISDCENWPQAPACKDPIYQSLDAAYRDQDQTYGTLAHTGKT